MAKIWENTSNFKVRRLYDGTTFRTEDLVGPRRLIWNAGPLIPQPVVPTGAIQALTVGEGTVAAEQNPYDNEPSYLAKLQLSSTSAAQTAGIYMGDVLNIQIGAGDANTKYTQAEVRLRVKTLGAVADTQLYWGLMSKYAADPDTIAGRAIFGTNAGVGSGATLMMHSDDNVTEVKDKNTLVSLVADDQFRTYRIDFTTPSAVKFYSDDTLQNGASVFDMSALKSATTDEFQMGVFLTKTTGTGNPLVYVEQIAFWGA